MKNSPTPQLNNLTILITGGFGYLGSRLAVYLRNNSHATICLGTRQFSVTDADWSRPFQSSYLDLCDEQSVERCLREVHPNVIIHLAGIFNDQQGAMEDFLEINTYGTYRLAKKAMEHGVERFLFFSTFQVYGHLQGDVSESIPPHPMNPYAISKYGAENIVQYFSRQSAVKSLIFRLSNAYGAPVHPDVNTWGLVFNSFCRQCVFKREIRIRSNQYRDFIPIHDVCRAVEHVLHRPELWDSDIFNLGGECCLSVLEVAQLIAEVFRRNFKKGSINVYCPDQQQGLFEPFRYNMDRLKKTGFALTRCTEEEIINTIKGCMELDQR